MRLWKINNPKTRLDITSKEVVSSLLICALVAYHIVIDNNVIHITVFMIWCESGLDGMKQGFL